MTCNHHLIFTGRDAPECDWPIGQCVYKNDPCPSGTKECNVGCGAGTNRCCCLNQPSTGSVTPKPTGTRFISGSRIQCLKHEEQLFYEV